VAGTVGAAASTELGLSWFIEESYGGAPYGDILVALQGGSGGGAGTDNEGRPYVSGGLGGGALELGAVDTIAIRGPGIYADGGQGELFDQPEVCWADGVSYGGGGGGSGGGILVHADSVALETKLGASGGHGGWGYCANGGLGGGGGGGRIAVRLGPGASSTRA
jgi:hypothetical protein